MSEPTKLSTPGLDRRDFIAAGTAVATASLLAPAGVFAGSSDVIKVGLIGCGGRGTGAARNILTADKGVELVAVGDVFEGQAKNAARQLAENKKYGSRVKIGNNIFSGLDNYKKVLESGIDLVILATPPGFRPYHLQAAVEAGKHIFTEKPVAVDGPGIRMVMAAYEESLKKKLAIVAGTQRRHQKGYIETVAQLHDGAIGKILSARAYWNGDGIWFKNRQPNQSDAEYQMNNWYHFVWTCGDHIVEQHVHNLDVINWITRSHPVRAYGMGGRSHRPKGTPQEVGHIFDHFAVEYEYADGMRLFSFCRHAPDTWTNISEHVTGEKGTCQVNNYNINGKKAGSDDGAMDPYEQEHVDLLRSIREGKPLNELKTVAESTLTAIMGRMATYTGIPITWEMALNSKEVTMPPELTLQSKITVPPVAIPGQTKFI